MSKFYSRICDISTGSDITKGSEKGLDAHVSGWDIGIGVIIDQTEDGLDQLHVFLTGGSNDSSNKQDIGVFTLASLERRYNLISVPKKKKGE